MRLALLLESTAIDCANCIACTVWVVVQHLCMSKSRVCTSTHACTLTHIIPCLHHLPELLPQEGEPSHELENEDSVPAPAAALQPRDSLELAAVDSGDDCMVLSFDAMVSLLEPGEGSRWGRCCCCWVDRAMSWCVPHSHGCCFVTRDTSRQIGRQGVKSEGSCAADASVHLCISSMKIFYSLI